MGNQRGKGKVHIFLVYFILKKRRILSSDCVALLKTCLFLHQELDLESIMLTTAKVVMSSSRSVNDICECVRAISKYICVQIDTEFEIEKQKHLKERIQPKNDEKSPAESASNSIIKE